MNSSYTHIVKHFKELTPYEVYSMLRLRNEVFVVEQNCVFQDADNKDLFCYHLFLYDGNDLIAYARLLPQGLSYEEMSIGRVVTSSKVRGTGAGKILMQLAIKHCYRIFGNGPIHIGAQVYAEKFYEGLGFFSNGVFYDEDGIPHVEMLNNQAVKSQH